MAWKGSSSEGFDYERLRNTLVNSRVHVENKGLYQVLKQLVSGASDFQDGISNAFDKRVDKIDLENQVDGMLGADNGGIESGYYFPDLVDVLNIAVSSTFYSHFIVSERYVQVYGKLEVQPTAPNTRTLIEVQLPIPSAFTSADQLHGLVNGVPLGGATEGFGGIITGNTTTGFAQFEFFPQSNNNFNIRYMFSYERVPI